MNLSKLNGSNDTWLKLLTALLTVGVLALGGFEVRQQTTPGPASSPVADQACESVNELRGTMREIILLARASDPDASSSEFWDRSLDSLRDAECDGAAGSGG